MKLTGDDGREYLDFLAGIGVCSLGHGDPAVLSALEAQTKKLMHVSNYFYIEQRGQVAALLSKLANDDVDGARVLADAIVAGDETTAAALGAPAADEQVWETFFANSGAEANEACIKLARRYMRKVQRRDAFEIITLSGCFHGRTLGTLAATGRESLSDGFTPLPEGFRQVPSCDLDALAAAMTPATAAVLLECVQGEGGIVPLPADYLRGVEALCRERGALLLCDEVQCGMGRTGRFWAFQHAGLTPDAISVAKSLANGLPMGAMLATDEAARGFEPGSHATTFGGGALTSAVAAKVVEILLRDDIPARAARLGAALMDRLRALQARLPEKIREVRGMGLMIGVELAVEGKPVWEELLRRGFICNLCHGMTLRLLPPLTIPEVDLDSFAVTLEDILTGR